MTTHMPRAWFPTCSFSQSLGSLAILDCSAAGRVRWGFLGSCRVIVALLIVVTSGMSPVKVMNVYYSTLLGCELMEGFLRCLGVALALWCLFNFISPGEFLVVAFYDCNCVCKCSAHQGLLSGSCSFLQLKFDYLNLYLLLPSVSVSWI